MVAYSCFDKYEFCSNLTDFDDTKEHKRLKLEPTNDECAVGSGNSYSFHNGSSSSVTSGNSSSNLRQLQFRDYVWAYAERYLAMEAMEAMFGGGEDDERFDEEDGGCDEMKLVQQLIYCVEAVACRDKQHASALLLELRTKAFMFGTSFQRVASCFVHGLSDRLNLCPPLGAVGILGPESKSTAYMKEKDESLNLVYEICPQIQFSHFVGNSVILEAFEGESSVHIIDLGMSLGLIHGQQWRKLIETIVTNGVSKPHSLRITGVGSSADRLQAIGDELEAYAAIFGLEFGFSYVETSLENLKPQQFKVFENEVVIINSIMQLHCVVKESRGALNSVLQALHRLSPKLLVLVEQDSNHNAPFFLGRFMEALHYYSAIFDSLDTMLPKYDTRRAKIEQFFYEEEIKNIVSCEGPARVERHERVDQWRRRMTRAAKTGMNNSVWDGFSVCEEKGCLVLGWKSKPIVAVSCWKCS